ncbi:hypothetical protein SO802_031958 [Lithocarpus litseifolius]|uniref:Uncharacterized protein n=1 Tax=Lithocarpus litseifolius TaxID=425828 RepID=A0AAW2BP90_9ROSI
MPQSLLLEKKRKVYVLVLEVVHCICLISVGRRMILQGFKMIYRGMPLTVATGIELGLTLHPQLQVKKKKNLKSREFNLYRNVAFNSLQFLSKCNSHPLPCLDDFIVCS